MVTVALERGTKIVVLPSLKMAPNQPRDPAGSSTGGQWSAARGSGASDATLETTARAMFNSPSHQARSLSEINAPNIGGQADAYGLEHQTTGYIVLQNPDIFAAGANPTLGTARVMQAQEDYREAQSNPAILAVDGYTSYDHYYMNSILKEDPAIIKEFVKNGHNWSERPDDGFTRQQVAENFALADAKSKTILVNAGLLTVDPNVLANRRDNVENTIIRSGTHIKELHNVIENAPSFEPTMVFRGVRAGITGPTIAEYEQAAKTGAIIQKNGFISTSLNTATATSFTDANVDIIPSQAARYHPAHIMEIVVTKGLAVKGTIANEQEVVLQHASKFRVIGVVDKLTGTGVPIKAVQLVQVNDPSTKMAPNQPRDPAGSSTGGQWSAARGGGQGAGASQAGNASLEAAARNMFANTRMADDYPSPSPSGAADAYGSQYTYDFEERENDPGMIALDRYTTSGYMSMNTVLKDNPEMLEKVVAKGHEWLPSISGSYTPFEREFNLDLAEAKTKSILIENNAYKPVTVPLGNGDNLTFRKDEVVQSFMHNKELHNVIANAPSFEPTMVFRGVREGTRGPTIDAYKDLAATGGTVKINGFLSTSLSSNVATGFLLGSTSGINKEQPNHHTPYVMQIVTNKGFVVKGGLRESEIIMQHGSTFKVLGVDKTPGGTPIVQLVLAQPTSTKMAPNQPRNPAGSSTGGQWVSAAGAGQAGGESIEAAARRMFSETDYVTHKNHDDSPSPGGAAEAYGLTHKTSGFAGETLEEQIVSQNNPGSIALSHYVGTGHQRINLFIKENPGVLEQVIAKGHTWSPRPATGYTEEQRKENIKLAEAKTAEILKEAGAYRAIESRTDYTFPADQINHSVMQAKELHKLIENAPSFEPTMVFRGVKEGHRGPTIAQYEKLAQTGGTIKMDKFVSTSLSFDISRKFSTKPDSEAINDPKTYHPPHLMHIVTNKGLVVKGWQPEQEILLQVGSSFKVMGVIKGPLNVPVVQLAVIN